MNKFIAWSQRDAKIRNGIFLLSMLTHTLTVVVMAIPTFGK